MKATITTAAAWLTVLVTLCQASSALGQTTVGQRVARYRLGLTKQIEAHEFRVRRASEELAKQAGLDPTQIDALNDKTESVLAGQRAKVESLLQEAATEFDQYANGNRPLGGPFKHLSDMSRGCSNGC
ncbi:MAG: hypothetical protein Aurels2KO_39970 [Aureliella sp.]